MSVVNFFLALVPIIWLIIALTALKMPGHRACVIALIITVCLAFGYWRLDAACTGTAVLEGVLNALWPICLVIIAALFTYNLVVRTGAMEAIKKMLGGVSMDMRVLALLIGWGFGCFMEGMAGFGTAVAIPASMLVGIGMNPIAAVVGCLVVNSTPTAFGSVGVPTVTLASVTGLDSLGLAGDIAIIQCILTFISPFFLVCICGGGVKALKGMLPITLVAAISFVVPWFITAEFLGAELPDIVGSVCCMICIILFARVFNKKPNPTYAIKTDNSDQNAGLTIASGLKAWSPFIFILVLLLGTSSLVPPVNQFLATFKTSVVVYAGEGGNTLGFSWINTPGVMIFIAAIIGGIIQGCGPKIMGEVLVGTLKAYWKTVLTICAVMAMAKVMSYSGMISDIAVLLVIVAGPLYPIIAPLIGALGAFVTGSGTSTSVLFGGLQAQTALDLDLSASWMAAANVMGAGIGKMICPQGIAIGASAAGLLGSESKILRSVFKYFVVYLVLAAALCMTGSLLGL